MSDGKNLIVRWNDNKAVTTCTNFVPLEPKSEGRRYVKKQGGHIAVEIPGPVHAYNQNMGGVDLFDQCLSNYRSSIRSKKWWWPLFQWGIDAARTNSWFIYQRSGRGGPQLPFIRNLAKTLVKGNAVPRPVPTRQGRPSACDDLRYDGSHHWPQELKSRYHRCKVCGGRTSVSCSKCDIPLHVKCFKTYHTQ